MVLTKQQAVINLTNFMDCRVLSGKGTDTGTALITQLAEKDFTNCKNYSNAINSRILELVREWGKLYYVEPTKSKIYRKWVACISTYCYSI